VSYGLATDQGVDAIDGAHLSVAPFEPHNIHNGFSGLAAGFPLAVYLFIGWENSAALAEETGNPRRNVPRAVFLSIALMAVSYLLFAYATVTGFGYNEARLTSPSILVPFITVAHGAAASLAFFAYLAGLTSTLGVLIAAVNSQVPEVPAGRVQRDQARGAAGHRDDRDRRPRLLPVQARAVGALQLVPLRRAGHPDRFGDLCRRADQV
jgi:hypothetical protein